jgi:hypothetical protein
VDEFLTKAASYSWSSQWSRLLFVIPMLHIKPGSVSEAA